MKIGVVTLVPSLNYGACLQAVALCRVLHELGHHPVLINKWMRPEGDAIWGTFRHKSLKFWIKFLAASLQGSGVVADIVRRYRTWKFLHKHLIISDFEFFFWDDAPAHLDCDLLVVGSDQVWRYNRIGIETYFLEGAPRDIPAIAYAASLGHSILPEEFGSLMKKLANRFLLISSREKSGVQLLGSCGIGATHVVDPVLLAGAGRWQDLLAAQPRRGRRKRLVAYLIAIDFRGVLDPLEDFARSHDCEVEVFTYYTIYKKPEEFQLRKLLDLELIRFRLRILKTHVRFRLSASPADFLNALSGADWVLANSFHALQFSILLDKNIRLIRHVQPNLRCVSSRIDEAVEEFCEPGIIFEDLSSALRSFDDRPTVVYNTKVVECRRMESLEWLKSALARAEKIKGGNE